MSSEQFDADDVLPESESRQFHGDGLDLSLYEIEQARMMDEQNLLRIACIENGDNAESFLKSNFGRYILGQADLESEQAKEALINADFDNKESIMKLQNRIHRLRSIKTWITSAIEQGNAEYIDYINSRNIEGE